MIADSQTALALLEYICQHPAEDDARLVYADWLDDHGDPERAEFIRVQLELANGSLGPLTRKPAGVGGYRVPRAEATRRKHRRIALRRRERELLEANFERWTPQLAGEGSGYLLPSEPTVRIRLNERYDDDVAITFHRGFPAEVTLTAEVFAGGPCGRRLGSGGDRASPAEARRYACERCLAVSDIPAGAGIACPHCGSDYMRKWRRDACPACRGTGQTPGYAAALFKSAPVEKVMLSDREPADGGAETVGGRWYWVGTETFEATTYGARALPLELASLLPGNARPTWRHGHYTIRYQTREAAHDALTVATLLYGRRRGWPCPRCRGEGLVDVPSGYAVTTQADCPDCAGLGHTVLTSA